MATYAPLNPVPQTWTTAPAANETVVWQVRSGTVLLTTGDTASDDAAMVLTAPYALPIGPNNPVRYRAATDGAHISRNAV